MKLRILLFAAATILLSASVGWAQTAPAANTAPIVGRAQIVGPDIIRIGDRNVLLFGIDAIERRQRCAADGKPWDCGTAAYKSTLDLVGDYEVSCLPRASDTFQRAIAVCKVNGKDLAEELVKAGMALAFRSESKDYVAVEDAARKAKAGVWRGNLERGDFQEPWAWREMVAGHPQPR